MPFIHKKNTPEELSEVSSVSEHQPLSVAIIGAGPIGIEAALRSLRCGFKTRVFETGPMVATHVRRWQHVQMFAQWCHNTTELGRETIEATYSDRENVDEEIELLSSPTITPTGADFIKHYLDPLGDYLRKRSVISFHSHVDGVSRVDLSKTESPGNRNSGRGFVLLVRDLSGSESYYYADAVIDASGCYWSNIGAGIGGLPPLGYDNLDRPFLQEIPDLSDHDDTTFLAARSVLIVGSGASAATSAHTFHLFNEEHRSADPLHITWFIRSRSHLSPIDNDPFPRRFELAQFTEAAIRGEIPHITPVIDTTILRVTETERENFPFEKSAVYEIEYEDPNNRGHFLSGMFDKVFIHTGLIPDLSFTRELQIHYCYATEGPMALSASLIQSNGGETVDCMAQPLPGYETIKTTEPNFFIVGTKSYARNSSFLLRIGHEQINLIFNALEESNAK